MNNNYEVTLKPKYQVGQIIKTTKGDIGEIYLVTAKGTWSQKGLETEVTYSLKNGGSLSYVRLEEVEAVLKEV